MANWGDVPAGESIATRLAAEGVVLLPADAAGVLNNDGLGVLSWVPAGTPGAHAASHQNGGADELNVGGLSGVLADPQPPIIGAGAAEAVAGNDARLGDSRTPTAHATSHQPGGSDAMAVDAAAGVGSLRTLGAGATQAAAGDHLHAGTYQPLDPDLTTIAGLTATSDHFLVADGGAWASRTPTQARTHLGLGTAALSATGDFATAAQGTDSRAPNGAASGDLGGTYPAPTVTQARGLRETGGPTTLAMGAVADGEYLRRSGAGLVGGTPAAIVAAPLTGDYATGSFTIATGKFGLQGRRLTLTGAQRGTVQGTSRLLIKG